MKKLKTYLLLAIVAYSGFVYAGSVRVWENLHIKLSSGKEVWGQVDKDGNCYHLLAGGATGSGIPTGNGVNCGGDINGSWAVGACNRKFTVNGGIKEVIEKIINSCNG